MEFIESIRVENGNYVNIQAHIQRMYLTMKHHYVDFQLPSLSFLQTALAKENLLEQISTKTLKCRIIYNAQLQSITFEPYTPRQIQSLKLLETTISYPYKYHDRTALLDLFAKRATADDVLLVKNKLLTDTSYSNIVLMRKNKLYTPSSYLLNGTQRQLLITKGIVTEQVIRADQLDQFECVYLINALLNLDQAVCVPVQSIF